jgi:Mg-chelatase subunit ChlD
MRLTATTDDDEIAALGVPGRASEKRRRNLERIGSLCTHRDTDISVSLSDDDALARPGAGIDDTYEILVPTQKYDQPQSDVVPAVWDRRLQIAFLFHELGHVRYSDFDRFGAVEDGISTRWRDLFRAVYNAAEDGVVETQIANEFSVGDDLILLNDTLVRHADRRHRRYVELFEAGPEDTPVQSYTVFEALSVGLLDRGYVDSGRFDEILDDGTRRRRILDGYDDVVRSLAPAIDEFMTDMLSEPDGAARVDRASDFFETVRGTFESLPPLQRRRVQTVPVKPADTQTSGDWPARRATQLPDRESAHRHVHRTQQASGTGRESTDEDDSVPPGTIDADSVRQAARRHRTHRRSRRGSVSSPLTREAHRLLDIVRDDGNDVSEVIAVEPADDGGDRTRWQAATEGSQQLIADLRTRLRRERRPRDRPGYRVGRLDDRRVVAGSNGEQRVFTRRETGVQKDYSCVLVLDRSGSMAGPHIEMAETAVGQLSHALFEVGVDVSVLSLWRAHACLELPFGAAPEESIDRLMTTRAAGGTPLSDAIDVARERLGLGSGAYPFVIVVTDGLPDDPERYRAALERCVFPVFGVYIDATPDGDAEYFDRVVHAETAALGQTLRRLVRRLFTGEA